MKVILVSSGAGRVDAAIRQLKERFEKDGVVVATNKSGELKDQLDELKEKLAEIGGGSIRDFSKERLNEIEIELSRMIEAPTAIDQVLPPAQALPYRPKMKPNHKAKFRSNFKGRRKH